MRRPDIFRRPAHTPAADLDEARERLAESKIKGETSLFNGSFNTLNPIASDFIEKQIQASKDRLDADGVDFSDPDALGKIAEEALRAINELDAATENTLQEKIDNRNKFQKLSAKFGKWLSPAGDSKLKKWGVPIIRNTMIGAGVGFTMATLGAGGVAIGAASAALAGYKLYAQKQAMIENTLGQDRSLKEGGDPLDIDTLEGLLRSQGMPANIEEGVQWAINELTNRNVESSKQRQRKLRVGLGVRAVMYAAGVAGGASDAFADRAGDFLGSVVEGGEIAVSQTADLVSSTSENFDMPNMPDIPDMPDWQLGKWKMPSFDMPDNIPFFGDGDTGVPEIEPTEQSDSAVGNVTEPSGESVTNAVENTTESTNQADAAIETSTADVNSVVETVGDIVSETAPNPDMLTDTMPVEYGDGVTHVLGRTLEHAGYGDLSPEQLYTTYEGLIDEVGPSGIFEGVTLELHEPTGDYWIMGDISEANLTPEAAEWIENNIGNIQDGADVELSVETDSNFDIIGPEDTTEQIIEPAEPAEVTVENEQLIEPITVEEGDGVMRVFEKIFESAGFEDLDPDIYGKVYSGLIEDVGPDKILENATLHFNEATGEYWIMGTPPFEANLTPEAAAWIEANVPELQALIEADEPPRGV